MFKHLAKLPPISPEPPLKGFHRQNRTRLLDSFRSATKIARGFLLFKGPIEQPVYDDDTEYLTIPEAHFTFLFGTKEPETFGLINIETGHSVLLVKLGDPQKSFWMKIKTLKEFGEEFEVDEARSFEDLKLIVADPNNSDSVLDVYLLGGFNPETGRTVWSPLKEAREKLPPEKVHESPELYKIFREVRSRKTEGEIRLISQATTVASLGVLGVLAYLQFAPNELQLTGHLHSVLKFIGDFDASNESVVAFGKNCGFWSHRASKFKTAKQGEIFWLSVGVRSHGYCGAVVRTLPVSGKFTDLQALAYNFCAEAFGKLVGFVKIGKTFEQVENYYAELLGEILLKLNVLKGKTKEIDVRKLFGLDRTIELIGADRWEPNPFEKAHDFKILEGVTFEILFGLFFNEDAIQKIKEDNLLGFVNLERFSELTEKVPGIYIGETMLSSQAGVLPLSNLLPLDLNGIELSCTKYLA